MSVKIFKMDELAKVFWILLGVTRLICAQIDKWMVKSLFERHSVAISEVCPNLKWQFFFCDQNDIDSISIRLKMD